MDVPWKPPWLAGHSTLESEQDVMDLRYELSRDALCHGMVSHGVLALVMMDLNAESSTVLTQRF